MPVDGADFSRSLRQGSRGAPAAGLDDHRPRALDQRHLDPLLEAIDQADHVVGRRPAGRWENGHAVAGRLPRRLVFAVPLLDVHSPCRLHRLEKLTAIPLQSGSSFLDTEILAKATFLGHLLDEVDVPPLRCRTRYDRLVVRLVVKCSAIRDSQRSQVQRKKRRAREKVPTAQAARIAARGRRRRGRPRRG